MHYIHIHILSAMDVFEAILLGSLQGLTEFLPVSSSGHLVIGQELLGVHIPGNAFEVVVHLGTLVSVLAVFWRDIAGFVKTIQDKVTRNYILALAVGTIPAVICGLFFKDAIQSAFDNVNFVAGALVCTGIILFVGKWFTGKKDQVSLRNSLLIGIAQAVAIIPGISRSGSTITAGLCLGVKSESAARFSFLLSIPAISGAGLLTALDLMESNEPLLSIPVMIAGFFSSFIVGWISLKWLLSLLQSGKFYWFGFYCVGIGILVWIV